MSSATAMLICTQQQEYLVLPSRAPNLNLSCTRVCIRYDRSNSTVFHSQVQEFLKSITHSNPISEKKTDVKVWWQIGVRRARICLSMLPLSIPYENLGTPHAPSSSVFKKRSSNHRHSYLGVKNQHITKKRPYNGIKHILSKNYSCPDGRRGMEYQGFPSISFEYVHGELYYIATTASELEVLF